uniref:Serine/threonine-protein kinase D1-3-like ubiquitin-like domain-containing protein n=1 Tax=Romanomermis culicivorax TaxID=13658 RepID=A0A915J3D0_ROMCU
QLFCFEKRKYILGSYGITCPKALLANVWVVDYSTISHHFSTFILENFQFLIPRKFTTRDPQSINSGQPMDDQYHVVLQMGMHKERLNLNPNNAVESFQLMREYAKQLVDRQYPAQKCPLEKILLFKHDYNSTNLLQILQTAENITNGTVVEIVLSSKPEKPTHPHALAVISFISPTFCDYCGEMLIGLKCALSLNTDCRPVDQANDLSYGMGSVDIMDVDHSTESSSSSQMAISCGVSQLGLEEKLSTGDMIQLSRIPGQASVRTSKPKPTSAIMEGNKCG